MKLCGKSVFLLGNFAPFVTGFCQAFFPPVFLGSKTAAATTQFQKCLASGKTWGQKRPWFASQPHRHRIATNHPFADQRAVPGFLESPSALWLLDDVGQCPTKNVL